MVCSYIADQINYAYPLFYEINTELASAPHVDLVLSPLWTMRPDVLSRFYLGDYFPVRIASIYDMAERELPIDNTTLFVVTPDELNFARQNPKFTHLRVIGSLTYPDGQPGFYFIHLDYVSGIDQIMAAEDALRQIPVVKNVKLANQQVQVTFSPINGGSIENLFDGDPNTFMRTLEANPAIIELDFPQSIKLSQIGIIHGNSPILFRVLIYSTETDLHPLDLFTTFAPNGQLADMLPLGKIVIAKKIRFEVRDSLQGVPGSVHIWEITLK